MRRPHRSGVSSVCPCGLYPSNRTVSYKSLRCVADQSRELTSSGGCLYTESLRYVVAESCWEGFTATYEKKSLRCVVGQHPAAGCPVRLKLEQRLFSKPSALGSRPVPDCGPDCYGSRRPYSRLEPSVQVRSVRLFGGSSECCRSAEMEKSQPGYLVADGQDTPPWRREKTFTVCCTVQTPPPAQRPLSYDNYAQTFGPSLRVGNGAALYSPGLHPRCLGQCGLAHQ
ncbi:hypothetical protein DEDE109153_15635 [Deinococcus deserti]